MKLIILMFTSSIMLMSCATIVSKSTNQVYIRTNPAGANITITDKRGKEVFKGQSPANMILKTSGGFFSKAEYQVKISSPGYAEKIVPIYYKLNGWYFGNLLFGGVLGMLVIDPLTGAMWKIVDPVIDETLLKSTTLNTTTPTLNIVDIKDVSNELKSKLVRIN